MNNSLHHLIHRAAKIGVSFAFTAVSLGLLAGCSAREDASTNATTTNSATVSPVATLTIPIGSVTPVPTYDFMAFDATVIALVTVLPTASPDVNLPPIKAADEQVRDVWDRAARTAIAQNPPPRPYPWTPPPTPPLTPEELAPHQTAGAGVIWEERSVAPCAKVMAVMNHWVETQSNQEIGVCAGAEGAREDPQRGRVAVFTISTSSYAILSGPDLYQTPLRAGPVRLVGGIGEQLTLRAEDGTLFYFDVPTRQWLTPTPGPSPPPSPAP